ncbi:hypothetical protein V1525DRAFT_421429 [Lipomyces kononenkoae]|uniref:Uncharacterized protein n=1 Tax=Lipomyces kononenkoae TaxID=34357 RepID=A0ACC3SVL7_LIPKO
MDVITRQAVGFVANFTVHYWSEILYPFSHSATADLDGYNHTFELARERESIHPLERCLIHPPTSGITGHNSILVKVVEPVRTGDRHNAQVVTIRTEYVPTELTHAIPTDSYFVAKIYDPLYFDHEQDDVDAFLSTDQEYSREAAAYRKLSFMQGTIIPKFYGTFTLELPVANKGISRSVRLIILEAIPGKPMTQLVPMDYSQVERQGIIKALIEAESLLYTNDVWHRDIHPRNVLVSGNVGENCSRRVIIVDFGKAWVGRAHPLLAPEAAKKYLPGIPISPVLCWSKAWWPYLQVSFAEWIDWDWEPWLEHHFGSTSAPITKDMEEIWRP